MKYFIKIIYLILLIVSFSLAITKTFAKETKIKYSKENIYNYFSGSVSLSQNYIQDSYKYLNKAQSVKNKHYNFNIQFIRSLILLNKFDQATKFANSVWKEEELFFEADLLIGLNYFINKDFKNAEFHFKRLNRISKYNLIFNDYLGNVLISWSKASQNNKKNSFDYLNKIPDRFKSLKLIQDSFLQCYFDTSKTEDTFKQLIGKDRSFSRYDFFLINYLISKNQLENARRLVNKSTNSDSSSLLIKQTKKFIDEESPSNITELFTCKNPKDSIAEIFYIISNLYSTEEDYQLSNFYLNISYFLNNKFSPNLTLRAENFLIQQKYQESKKVYNSIKKIGSVYSWHSAKSIANILLKTKSKKKAIFFLKNEFNLIKEKDFENYYDLANFYKDNKEHEEAIKYYSLTLKRIKPNHTLIPKILYKRGTSYERLDKWIKAEIDLKKSLKILPDQPHVLNYLAYTWVEKGTNIDQSLKMLKQATDLKKNDPYIVDSLGWAHYMNKNYIDAEIFLQTAVKLMPLDPVINDHYADTLWMLNKNIQARYFWNYVLSLKNTEKELKDKISKKLISGI
jgi:tetratricopeptide (TPR) repeat protein